jgi:hypothetical protein
MMAEEALKEDYYLFREMALSYLLDAGNVSLFSTNQISKIALNDNHSQVRLAALDYLVEMPGYDATAEVISVLESEKAYPVLAYCLGYLSTVDYTKAAKYADQLKSEQTNLLDEGLSIVFSKSDEDKYDDWFATKVETTNIFNALPLYLGYTSYSLKHNPSNVDNIINGLKQKSTDFSSGVYQRYFPTMILSNLKMMFDSNNQSTYKQKVVDAIKFIKQNEKDPMLLGWYSQM